MCFRTDFITYLRQIAFWKYYLSILRGFNYFLGTVRRRSKAQWQNTRVTGTSDPGKISMRYLACKERLDGANALLCDKSISEEANQHKLNLCMAKNLMLLHRDIGVIHNTICVAGHRLDNLQISRGRMGGQVTFTPNAINSTFLPRRKR